MMCTSEQNATMQPTQPLDEHSTIDPSWPPEVSLILSALDAGQWHTERRSARRTRYHVKAALRLLADPPDADEKCLYTRNVGARSLGFLTPHRLPLGYGGIVRLPSPRRDLVTIRCTLLRCRETAPGWYEGALHFNRNQIVFDRDVMESSDRL